MVLEKIRQHYEELTRSQRRIAEFVASSYQTAAFMTASQIAERMRLNEATVVRFAQRLGYAGYPEMNHDIQELVQRELGAESESTLAAEDDPLGALVADQINSLRRLTSHVPRDLAQQAIEMLRQAREIHIVGYGLSQPLAQLMALNLQILGFAAHCAPTDPLSMASVLRGVGEGCVVVAISLQHACQQLANALAYAHSAGARTLAIAQSPTSPCATSADLALSCPPVTEPLLPSLTLSSLLIDLLLRGLALGSESELPSSIRATLELRDRLGAE